MITVDELLSKIVYFIPHSVLPCSYTISRDKTFTLFAGDGTQLLCLSGDSGLSTIIDMHGVDAFDEMKNFINSDLTTYAEFRKKENMSEVSELV